jgi:hypothetical protein
LTARIYDILPKWKELKIIISLCCPIAIAMKITVSISMSGPGITGTFSMLAEKYFRIDRMSIG